MSSVLGVAATRVAPVAETVPVTTRRTVRVVTALALMTRVAEAPVAMLLIVKQAVRAERVAPLARVIMRLAGIRRHACT